MCAHGVRALRANANVPSHQELAHFLEKGLGTLLQQLSKLLRTGAGAEHPAGEFTSVFHPFLLQFLTATAHHHWA